MHVYVRYVRWERDMATDPSSSVEVRTRPLSLRAAPRTSRGQTRRAWRVLLISFVCFAIILSGIGIGFSTYRSNATKPRGGSVRQIVTGSQAQVRSRQQS